MDEHQLLQKGDIILIACSGGPDSIALLHHLYEQREAYHLTLRVVYIHHHLRLEADAEMDYVGALAAELGLPFETVHIDVVAYAKEYGMSIEQAGHVLRHQVFRELGEEHRCTKLALGHHMNDRAETILQHMIRGLHQLMPFLFHMLFSLLFLEQ